MEQELVYAAINFCFVASLPRETVEAIMANPDGTVGCAVNHSRRHARTLVYTLVREHTCTVHPECSPSAAAVAQFQLHCLCQWCPRLQWDSIDLRGPNTNAVGVGCIQSHAVSIVTTRWNFTYENRRGGLQFNLVCQCTVFLETLCSVLRNHILWNYDTKSHLILIMCKHS